MNWLGRKPAEEEQAEARPLGFDDFDLRLGDIMRGERATLGKSLLDVQRELHIRAAYITAIENGDLTAFEAQSFVAGYVRSYAKYLNLNPEWAYAKFCAETGFAVPDGMSGMRSPRTPANPAAKQVPEGLLTRISITPEPQPLWRRIEPGALGSMAILLALIGGLGYGAWAILTEVQRVQLAPADQAPEVLADLDPLNTAGTLLAAGNDPSFAPAELPIRAPETRTAEGSVRVYRPQGLDVPVMESRDGPIAAITPSRDSGSTSDFDSIAAAVSEALSTEAPMIQVVENEPPTVELLAVRPSWVRVRSADGTVLFEKILDAGERYTVPQTEAPANLRAGNSGSLYFVINGEPFGPAAPGAQVVNNVTLSADALRDSYEVADLERDADLNRLIAVANAAGN
ncbi:MAG: helix-turn-helix domain-containing protein [Rhodobacteraceae bacterium]|nr:helix-turn-helix domain-containing protein [Paracoccaceae bacterium]